MALELWPSLYFVCCHETFGMSAAPRLSNASPHGFERIRESSLRDVIGNAPAFAKQVARLRTIAACAAGVLILGETGTGKEVFCRAIHYQSERAGKPLVAVNCGAIPHELIESELFGHVRGAYTTAHASREGLVQEAEGGSLFLDDVDCLPPAAQVKLLRFVEEKEYRPVGSSAVRRADVRVIAASNRDLGTLAARGDFRSDLFYRLNVLTLALPPLRERREDIVPLAQHFALHFARELQRPARELSAAALHKLMVHTWPGNVRELRHVIERTLLLAPGPSIDADDIQITGAVEMSPATTFQEMKARVIEDFERSYIEALLSRTHGNVTHAALAAGKNRRAFFELIRKHGITPERFRSATA
jgi:DNA-binding NtrC family response regulator